MKNSKINCNFIHSVFKLKQNTTIVFYENEYTFKKYTHKV